MGLDFWSCYRFGPQLTTHFDGTFFVGRRKYNLSQTALCELLKNASFWNASLVLIFVKCNLLQFLLFCWSYFGLSKSKTKKVMMHYIRRSYCADAFLALGHFQCMNWCTRFFWCINQRECCTCTKRANFLKIWYGNGILFNLDITCPTVEKVLLFNTI